MDSASKTDRALDAVAAALGIVMLAPGVVLIVALALSLIF
jgi:lipopolysaccharide/colanic/teichoic acid biosynthesis glycosyltransferase